MLLGLVFGFQGIGVYVLGGLVPRKQVPEPPKPFYKGTTF